MATVSRDGSSRRIYRTEFKRPQIGRIERGEISAAEPSRELGIGRSLIQRWKHRATHGSETAGQAAEEVVRSVSSASGARWSSAAGRSR